MTFYRFLNSFEFHVDNTKQAFKTMNELIFMYFQTFRAEVFFFQMLFINWEASDNCNMLYRPVLCYF